MVSLSNNEDNVSFRIEFLNSLKPFCHINWSSNWRRKIFYKKKRENNNVNNIIRKSKKNYIYIYHFIRQ